MTYEEVCKYSEDQEIEIKVFSNPSYKNSIIGLTVDDRAIYDMEQMIVDLMEEDKISYIDALEFIEYNTIRALPYMGGDAPIILYTKEF